MKKMKEGKKYTEKDDEISKPKLHTKTCWAEIKSDIQKTNYRNWLKINMKQFLYFRFIFLYFIRNIILYKNIEKLIFWIRKQNWANFGHRDLLFSNNEGRHILQLALCQKRISRKWVKTFTLFRRYVIAKIYCDNYFAMKRFKKETFWFLYVYFDWSKNFNGEGICNTHFDW